MVDSPYTFYTISNIFLDNIKIIIFKHFLALQLQKALKETLVKPRKLSKKVIFEDTPTEYSSICWSNCFDSAKVFSYIKPVIPKNVAIFEVGNGYINELFKKDLDHLNKKVFISTKNGNQNEFLMSLGR